MLATMTSKLVGDMFTKSLYEAGMELKSIPYLEEHAPIQTRTYLVTTVMASPVVTLREIESLDLLVRILRDTTHHGFPVVSNDERKTYRGFIMRKQLYILLSHQPFYSTEPASEKLLTFPQYSELMHTKTFSENLILTLPSETQWSSLKVDLRSCMSSEIIIILSF